MVTHYGYLWRLSPSALLACILLITWNGKLWRSAMRVHDTCVFDPHIHQLGLFIDVEDHLTLYSSTSDHPHSKMASSGPAQSGPFSSILKRVQLKTSQEGRSLSVWTKCWTSLTKETRYLRTGCTPILGASPVLCLATVHSSPIWQVQDAFPSRIEGFINKTWRSVTVLEGSARPKAEPLIQQSRSCGCISASAGGPCSPVSFDCPIEHPLGCETGISPAVQG